MNLIWATRGRSWGFRFLLDGGFADPLPTYEQAFAGLEDDRAVCRKAGGRLALRFPDPLGRKPAATTGGLHPASRRREPGGFPGHALGQRRRLGSAGSEWTGGAQGAKLDGWIRVSA
ncbi:MAG: hypothetical protein KIT69_02240 [Propionibacteriaceae bacterium]|nr:hypothetical protein [Propionibacteriaceae bacterium]